MAGSSCECVDMIRKMPRETQGMMQYKKRTSQLGGSFFAPQKLFNMQILNGMRRTENN